jgi:xylan 1,4-beta-xylosidase
MMIEKRFNGPLTRVAFVLLLLFSVYAMSATAQKKRVSYENPVIAGDYPDPSIIRVGGDYWATATSSDWAPEFPIMHSRDLVNWEVWGAVFQKRPDWSNGNYWAPEISEYRGRYFVYYVGHKKQDGPLCVAVATARKPDGPYTDHGPIICQDDGSIDPVAVTDERGERYLVWKEDGNSRNQPTPIWAQKLSSDGTKLTGARQELIRNDAKWEAQLVEGPFILRRNGWFYMFYSGNACCGRECNYALGVARSRKLLGPWEKNPGNPILRGNETWKCPGHGSIVSDQNGKDFLLYHAYHARDTVYVGREALLDEVSWGKGGWPSINGGHGPTGRSASPQGARELNAEYSFFDEFNGPKLRPGWQWPQNSDPVARIDASNGGWLLLSSKTMARPGDMLAAVIARSTTVGDYVATAVVNLSGMKAGQFAGLSAFGDLENALGVAVGSGKVLAFKREKSVDTIVGDVDAPASNSIWLRLTAKDGHRFRFAMSTNGRDWKTIGEEMEGQYLPPWDRGVRVALTGGGTEGAVASFGSLRITPSR